MHLSALVGVGDSQWSTFGGDNQKRRFASYRENVKTRTKCSRLRFLTVEQSVRNSHLLTSHFTVESSRLVTVESSHLLIKWRLGHQGLAFSVVSKNLLQKMISASNEMFRLRRTWILCHRENSILHHHQESLLFFFFYEDFYFNYFALTKTLQTILFSSASL